MDLGIRGKVALVAAGSKGLGRATALALASEGVGIMLSGRDEDTLQSTRSEVAALGVPVAMRSGDVTDPGEPARLVAGTVDRLGSLDILVANAGGPPPGRALDLDDAALEAALNANLLTSVRLVREAVPHMRRAGWGRICCITSYTVVQAAPGWLSRTPPGPDCGHGSRRRRRIWRPTSPGSRSTCCAPVPTPRTA